MGDGDDFLSRWSRRKREQQAGLRRREAGTAPPAAGEQTVPRPGAMIVEAPTPDATSAEAGESGAPPQPETISSEELAELEKTDFDALDYSSDYTAFMREGVPDALRRRALRRLWQSDPVLANIDGLNDYDEDFTDAALVVKALQSAYNVGRGYFTQEEIDEMQAEEAGDAVAEGAQTEERDTEVVHAPSDPGEDDPGDGDDDDDEWDDDAERDV